MVRLELLPARHPLEVVLPLGLLQVLERLLGLLQVLEFHRELMALFPLSWAWALQGWVWDRLVQGLECCRQGLLVHLLMMKGETTKVWGLPPALALQWQLEPDWVQGFLRELPELLQALEEDRGMGSRQVTSWVHCSLEPQ